MPYFERPSPSSGLPSPSVPKQAVPDFVAKATHLLGQETNTRSVPAAPELPSVFKRNDMLEANLDQLRRQAADLIEGVIAAATQSGPGPTPPTLTAPSTLPSPLSVPWLQNAVAGKAGAPTTFPLPVNSPTASSVDVVFYATELLSDSGSAIPGRKVTFSPRTVRLVPGQPSVVQVTIDVPSQAQPGLYTGLLQGTGTDAGRTVVTIKVD